MKRFLFGLIALAMTASFAVAQDDPAPKQTTETVWTATIAGIGGWGAAKTAKRARAALEKMDGVESVVVDTTARAVIRMKKDKAPTKESMNEILGKLRCRVKSVEKTEVPTAVEMVSITIEGLGWQDTAQSVRETLEKVDGVIFAFTDGDAGSVEVHAKKASVLTKESATSMIEKAGKFKVTGFSTKSLVKTKEAWSSMAFHAGGRSPEAPASRHVMGLAA